MIGDARKEIIAEKEVEHEVEMGNIVAAVVLLLSLI